MQLGARWRVGEAPHRGVPDSLHSMIREQEHAFPEAHAWTLTWLEGRPRCALDDLVIVTLVGVEQAAGSGSPGGAAGTDDDDDDWLN